MMGDNKSRVRWYFLELRFGVMDDVEIPRDAASLLAWLSERFGSHANESDIFLLDGEVVDDRP